MLYKNNESFVQQAQDDNGRQKKSDNSKEYEYNVMGQHI